LGLTFNASAFDITAEAGQYDPNEGIVRDLFKTSFVYSLKLNYKYYESFDWVFSLANQYMENRVASLETELTLNYLNAGFEKRLMGPANYDFIIPFVGAGFSKIQIVEVLENETTDKKSSAETTYVNGSFWEIGLLVRVFSQSWIEVRIAEQNIQKDVLGNIHLGGRISSLGVRLGF